MALGITILFLIFTPFLAFNLFIDPYSVFFNCMKNVYFEPNKRYLKVKYLINNPKKFDSFIFGSSRANYIDPEKIKEANYFNMTYSAGIPKDHMKDLRIMARKGVKIKNLIIGLDFLSLLYVPELEENDLLRQPYPESIHEYYDFIKKYLFYLPDKSVIKLMTTKGIIDRTGIFTNGILALRPYDVMIDTKVKFYNARQGFTIPSSSYDRNSRVNIAIPEIKEIIDFAKANHVNIKFFINPVHYTTYLNLNLDKYFEALRELAKITDFYDFSGLNSVCTDNMYFEEPSHFRLKTGDLIISRLFNEQNPAIPADFGRFVNSQNIDSQILYHKKIFDEFFESIKLERNTWLNLDLKKLKKTSEHNLIKLNTINSLNTNILKEPFQITTPWIKLNISITETGKKNGIQDVFVMIDDRIAAPVSYSIKSDSNRISVFDSLQSEGYNITIPTKDLEDGLHTVILGAFSKNRTHYSISEKEYSFSVYHNKTIPYVRNLDTLTSTAPFQLNRINGIAENEFNLVGNSGFLHLSGRAYDTDGQSASGGIILTIDGNSYPMHIAIDPPVKAELFVFSGMLSNEWAITVPLNDQNREKHELSFHVINKESTGYYKTNVTKTLLNIESLGDNELNSLEINPNGTQCFIDMFNGSRIDPAKKPIRVNGETITVSGWAVDHPAKKPANKVLIDIDGRLFRTNYGSDRPDVAKAYKQNNYRKSGWKTEIPVCLLKPGKHVLSLKIISNNSKSFYSIDNQIVFITE